MSTPEESIPQESMTVMRFKVDALQSKVEQIRLKASEVSEAAMRAVKAAMKAVGVRDQERGPDDYPDDEERVTIPVRWLEKAMRSSGGGYHESGSQLLKWILGVLTILTASVIIGGVSFYGRFMAFESGVTEWQRSADRRLDALERKP